MFILPESTARCQSNVLVFLKA